MLGKFVIHRETELKQALLGPYESLGRIIAGMVPIIIKSTVCSLLVLWNLIFSGPPDFSTNENIRVGATTMRDTIPPIFCLGI